MAPQRVLASSMRSLPTRGRAGDAGVIGCRQRRTSTTTDIFLESRTSIRGTRARRDSPSASRPMRATIRACVTRPGSDLPRSRRAAHRWTRGGRVEGSPADVYAGDAPPNALTVRTRRVSQVLGESFQLADRPPLRSIGFTVDVARVARSCASCLQPGERTSTKRSTPSRRSRGCALRDILRRASSGRRLWCPTILTGSCKGAARALRRRAARGAANAVRGRRRARFVRYRIRSRKTSIPASRPARTLARAPAHLAIARVTSAL